MMKLKENAKYALVTPTSMGVRITPQNRQPVHTSKLYSMQATSAESNVLTVPASLGMPVKALTTFVAGSPIARFIKDDLGSRHIDYEGPEVAQGGPWGYRHQFNIADSGFGMRGPRVHNDRAGEVGRTLDVKDFDLERIFGTDGARILHISGLIAAMSPETSRFCLALVRAAKAHGTCVSFDLNYRASFWKGRKEDLSKAFAEMAAAADILIGNEEDFQLCLGLEGPEAGGKDLSAKLDSFKAMIGSVQRQYPGASVFCHHPAGSGQHQRTPLGRHTAGRRSVERGRTPSHPRSGSHRRRGRLCGRPALWIFKGLGARAVPAFRLGHRRAGCHHAGGLRHARRRGAGVECLGRQRPGQTIRRRN